MATSLSHIPAGLLIIEAHDKFINWLAAIPAPARAKGRVLRAWAKHTGHTLTETDYSKATAPALPGLVHAAS